MRGRLFLLHLLACGPFDAPSPPEERLDVEAQASSLSSLVAPNDDSTIAGTVDVRFSSDREGGTLEVWLDDVPLGMDETPPLQVTVDTTRFRNGLHRLTLLYVDPRMRSAGPQERRVWISNDTHGRDVSDHLWLGVPDASSALDATHYLLTKRTLASSYNDARLSPNWVSWEAASRWLGTAGRTDRWKAEPLLPAALRQPSDDDYKHSGFDRGHMCPSADRTLDEADNQETFRWSNALPQRPSVNNGVWKSLESYVREAVRSGTRRAFVVAGPLVAPDEPSIGGGVAVPNELFKVAVILPSTVVAPNEPLFDLEVIAVRVPNDADAPGTWRDYQVSVRALEHATGMSFLSDLSPETQDRVER